MTASRACNYLQNAAATTYKKFLQFYAKRSCKKHFTDFCKSVNAIQSMSKTGYPYDNAPMERYFNAPKNECTNLYKFQTKEALCQAVEEFEYVRYNHVRPHSYNDYRTPYQARIIG